MEDCCAVCAEPLEFIAYGPCGHREVCSTCTARLRVVLDDKRCCICKQECPTVFVTKAMGDYTKVVSDFGGLSRSHQNGELWFEGDIGAYFDDEDEFKRIKAMCRLQCKVCEHAAWDSAPAGAVRKGFVFKNLETLRRHIFSVHRLTMCSLCLEGRKVFIQDQKLYTRAQLERHSSKGDSIVDEEERGAFSGHPMCAFCTRRFYSENELYHHMSTEHFTCHICQRTRPGQFEYYQNYDDLEAHFRNEHNLCEDPECLAKKFIVFSTEGELKVHNAKEHGGSLSRAQRNAALKIPVSYQFRRSGQQGESRGSYYRGSRGNDLNTELLSTASEMEESNTSGSGAAVASNPENFPALAAQSEAATSSTRESSDGSSRWYLSAVHSGRSSSRQLNEGAFPPLPGATQSQQQRQAGNQRPLASSLFREKSGKVKVLNASSRQQAGPSETRPPESRPNGTVVNRMEYPDLQRSGNLSSSRPSGTVLNRMEYPDLQRSCNLSSSGRIGGGGQSTSGGITRNAEVTQTQKLSMDEIRAATKVLIDQIRDKLKGDEEKFASFKEVQAQFRKGELDTKLYYDQVEHLGLSDILPELARLCPDPQKQQELLQVMKEGETGGKRSNGFSEQLSRRMENAMEEVEVLSKDGYRKRETDTLGSSSSSNGPLLLLSDWACERCTLVNKSKNAHCAACGCARGGTSANTNTNTDTGSVSKKAEDAKKRKPPKVSKFLRTRLGEGASEESPEDIPPPPPPDSVRAARGAWRNGGGHRLAASSKSGW